MTVFSVVHMPICKPSGEQIDWPGVVQEPVEEPVDAVPEAEAGAALEPDELPTGAGAEPATGEAATEGAAAAAEGEPATEGAAAATEGAAAAAGAAEDIKGAAAGAAAPEAPELPALEASVPEEALDELPDAPHLGPVGGAKTFALLALAISTDCPGSGNLTSEPSAVVQSVAGMFAMNMSGNEAVARSESSGIAYSSVSLREVSLLLEPPVTLMEAQFMYISRLPTLLNQVHARVYAPGVMPVGIEKSYISGSIAEAELSAPILPAWFLAGQPP